MKTFRSIISLLLAVTMLVPMLTAWTVTAAGTMTTALDAETYRSSKLLYPGVISTNIKTSGSSKYDLQSFNIVEFDLSQTDLYIDVTNERDYVSRTKTTLNTVTSFNANNGKGKTAIAAINGDLWTMTSTHSRVEGSGTSYSGYSDAVVTKSMTLPRGFSIYDSEIVCSSQIEEETPYEGDFWSFGVSDGYVPMIGCPELEISVKNNTRNVTVEADGLNRLPANNALILYSDKGCASTNSLSDAYEVVIDVDYDYTVEHGASVTGIVTGIYNSLSPTSNPTMKANRFILTGRGTALDRMTSFTVGDTVTLDFSVYERYGRNTEGWQNATCAVGGHMPFVVDGVKWQTGTTTNYPTTIVGIKNDGNVVFIVNDGRQSSFSTGLDFNDYWDFADDMDLNTAFILDGGGSANLIETTGSGYSVVNSPSDGTTRAVVNSVILSAGPGRAAQDSFNVKVPSSNIDLTNLNFADDDAYLLLTNFAETELSKTPDGVMMKAKDVLNGPGLSISYGLPNTSSPNSNSVLSGRSYDYVNAADYPYLVLDMAVVTSDPSLIQFQSLYHTAGSRKGQSEATFIGFNNAYNNAGFQKYIIHTGSNAVFKGRLNTFNLTYLYPANGVTVRDGDYVILRSARLARTAEEAQAMTMIPTSQTVTFNGNGGVVDQSVKYAVHGQKYGVMPVPTRSGYDFVGWYSAVSGGEKVTENSNVTSADTRILYAQWKESSDVPQKDPMYISFDLNEGSGAVGLYEVMPGQSYRDAVGGDLREPTRTGYDFAGWWNGDYQLDLDDIHNSEQGVTFTAQWSPRPGKYLVTASSLGHRTGPDTSYSSTSVGSVSQNTILDVTEVSGRWGKCTVNGVEGWSSLNYTVYVEALPDAIFAGNYWQRLAVFRIDLNGGFYNALSGAVSGTVTANGIGLNSSGESFDVYVYHATSTPTTTYFNNNYFGVVYRNGEMLSTKACLLGDLMYVIYNSLERGSYEISALSNKFIGEFTGNDFLSTSVKIDKSYLDGSGYTFKPLWEAQTYTLTLDPDGGTMPDEYETAYTFVGDARLTDVIGGFPVPVKKGYNFAGWQREDYAPDWWREGWGTQPYTFGKDITVVARWEDATFIENGTVTEDNGKYYLEVEGVRQEKGLYNVGGDYYYVKFDGTLARNEEVFTYYDRNVLPRAYYRFMSDCKMMKNGWLEMEDGAKFYFIDGRHASGVTQIDGDYYFFNINNGEMQKNKSFFIGENSLGLTWGIYHFGADGRMQISERAVSYEASRIATTYVVEGSGLANYIESTEDLALVSQSDINISEKELSDEDDK